MARMDVTQMPFAKLYPLLVNKAEKKGRTRQEVDQVTAWLTGYTAGDIARMEQSDLTYGEFFRNAPAPPSQPDADYRQGVRHPGGGNRGPADAGNPLPGQAGGRSGKRQGPGPDIARGLTETTPTPPTLRRLRNRRGIGGVMSGGTVIPGLSKLWPECL